MITDSEISRHAERHGVPEMQVRRDWMISHVLHALASIQQETPIVFYGGTALCRTWCPDLRLSEDIDLLALNFLDATEAVPKMLRRLLRHEFPDLTWIAGPIRDRMVTAQLEAGPQTVSYTHLTLPTTPYV